MTLSEQEELELLRLRKKKAQQAQMLHPARQWSPAEQVQMGLAQQAGVPIADVSLSQGNAGPGARFSAGYLTDTPAEQRAFLEKQYPGDQRQGNVPGLRLVDDGWCRGNATRQQADEKDGESSFHWSPL